MKIKLLFAAVLTSCLAFSATAFAADTESPFSDVDTSTSQGKAIVEMYEKGYLNGYGDGTFKPENSITRAELTRVFNQVFGYSLDEAAAAQMTDFSDNADSEAWYYNDVRIAQSNGYINGFEDGSFRPQSNFTREQTCTVIFRAANLESPEIAFEISDPVSEWAKAYVNANISSGVFSLEADNTFRAKENITRAEACEALAKFIKTETGTAEITTASDLSTETTTFAETESGTETTTKSSSSSSGGGGGGGSSSSSSSSSTVESTTETTTIDPADIELTDEQMDDLAVIISITKTQFIPICYKSDQKAIAQLMLTALEGYYADSSYDIVSDIEEAKEMYRAMSDEDQDEFRNKALSTYPLDSYATLMPLFEAFL